MLPMTMSLFNNYKYLLIASCHERTIHMHVTEVVDVGKASMRCRGDVRILYILCKVLRVKYMLVGQMGVNTVDVECDCVYTFLLNFFQIFLRFLHFTNKCQ